MSTPTAIAELGALGETLQRFAASLSSLDPSRVNRLLGSLRDAFAEHRANTEGADGLYAGVVTDAPRLAGTVDGLVADHASLETAMTRLAEAAARVSADVDVLHQRAVAVLTELVRHRQRDSDLVYEAYTTDIGGE
jgi:hypothetical protein